MPATHGPVAGRRAGRSSTRAAGRAAGRAAARHSAARRIAVAGVGVYTAAVVAVFAFFYPVLAAQTIPTEDWQDRMWISSWI